MNFISLFCGCGGFDLGFIKAGFKCKAAFDIDRMAITNYSNYFNHKAIEYDLLHGLAVEEFNDIDVVIAGPPCQGFSTAGKRRYDDPRNHLLLKATEIAIAINPKIFILENVNGVVAGRHKDYWNKAQTMLKDKYSINELFINTEELGIAQTRKRRLLFASRTSDISNISLPKKNKKTLKETISGIKKTSYNHEPKYLDDNSRIGIISGKIKPGQKLSNVRGGNRSVHTWHIPKVFGKTTVFEREVLEAILKLRRRSRLRESGDADPITANTIVRELEKPVTNILHSLIKKNYVRQIENRYDLTHTFNGKHRRLCWETSAPTVDTRFGDPRYFLHPEENRGLTVREAARIQEFPDDYEFLGNDTIQYRLVGNAVPPVMSKEIGKLVKEIIA